jgi:hypothetical protein
MGALRDAFGVMFVVAAGNYTLLPRRGLPAGVGEAGRRHHQSCRFGARLDHWRGRAQGERDKSGSVR